MKKIKKSISWSWSTAQLFLDDLEKIDKIFKDNSLSYTLILDDYELESIDEIKSIEEKQKFSELSIRSIRSIEQLFTLSIYIDKQTHIYCDDEYVLVGIIEKIKPIIKKRRKIWYNIREYEWLIPSLLSLINFEVYSKSQGLYFYIFSTIILLWWLKIWIIKSPKNIVFIAKKSNDKTNYFMRNKDQIVTTLLSSFIGLGVGIFLTLFRMKITSP